MRNRKQKQPLILLLGNVSINSNNNIISGIKSCKDIVQSQGSYSSHSNSETLYLKKEIEFLRSQLEFTQNLLDKLIRKEGKNA